MDWIGIYPVALPTLPGLSHGRWRYISACEMAKDGTISVNFNPQSSLPNHEGVFELRVHLNNEYGTPVLRSNPIHFLDAPISKVGRLILMIAFLGIVWFLQHLLNAKGGCDFVDPLTHNDVNGTFASWFLLILLPQGDLGLFLRSDETSQSMVY
jgi:hypothetical protein